MEKELYEAVRGLKNQNEGCFEAVYELSKKYIFKIIYDIVRDYQITEDLMQETYLQIYQNIGSLREEGTFLVWAGRIATNQTLRYLEKNRKEVLLSGESEAENENFFYASAGEDDEKFIPESILLNQEKWHYLEEIIDGLSTAQKLSIQYYYYEKLSVHEIAEAMNCSEGTVKSRLNYARTAIKDAVLMLEQTKGIRLYSLAEAPFFYLVFRESAEKIAAGEAMDVFAAVRAFLLGTEGIGATAAAGAAGSATAGAAQGAAAESAASATAAAEAVVEGTAVTTAASMAAASAETAKSVGAAATGKALFTGFMHSTAGKILMGILLLDVAFSGVANETRKLPEEQEPTPVVAEADAGTDSNSNAQSAEASNGTDASTADGTMDGNNTITGDVIINPNEDEETLPEEELPEEATIEAVHSGTMSLQYILEYDTTQPDYLNVVSQRMSIWGRDEDGRHFDKYNMTGSLESEVLKQQWERVDQDAAAAFFEANQEAGVARAAEGNREFSLPAEEENFPEILRFNLDGTNYIFTITDVRQNIFFSFPASDPCYTKSGMGANGSFCASGVSYVLTGTFVADGTLPPYTE